jgi:hypothetical protein
MIRWTVLVGLFVLLSTVELSFISALSPTLRTIPFLFAVSITLLQHHGVRAGAWYVAAFGVLLDAFGLSVAFPMAPGAMLAALAADRFSRAVFSNRSYYGLIGCGASAFGIQTLWQALVLLARSAFLRETVRWTVVATDTLSAFLWLGVWLTILFFAAGGIRRLLGSAFLLPSERRTLT